MRKALFVTALIAIGAVVLAGVSPSTNDERSASWQKVLRALSKKHGIGLAVDVNLGVDPPDVSEIEDPRFALDLLSELSGRHVGQTDGVVTLSRASGSGMAVPSRQERQLDWISTLSGEEIKAIAKGRFNLSDLSADSRASVLGFLPLTSSQVSTCISKPESVRLSLGVWVEGRFHDSKLDKDVQTWAWTTSGTDSSSRASGKVATAANSQIPANPFSGAPTDGSLSVSPGEVMTVGEAVGRASKAFAKTFVFDHRLREAPVFLSGTFTLSRFQQVLETILRPVALRNLESESGIRARLKALLGGQLRDLSEIQGLAEPGRDLVRQSLAEPTVSGESLSGYDGLTQAMVNRGLHPNEVQVRLRAMLALTVTVGEGSSQEGATQLIGG